jgi:hypothetical protein
MFLLIYLVNNIIRVACAYGMFLSFGRGYYLLAAILLLGALKRDWLVFDTMSYKNKIQFGVNSYNCRKKR